jgi:hypothetical protein
VKILNFSAPFFDAYTHRYGGHLPKDVAAHALFYYHLLARKQYESNRDNLVYEGEKDKVFNPRGLWMTIAGIYGVDPNEMGNYWEPVMLELMRQDLPALPKQYCYGIRNGALYKTRSDPREQVDVDFKRILRRDN